MAANYQPTLIDCEWAKSTLAMIVDGGVLAYRSTGLIYLVDQRAKRLTLMNPELLMIVFESYVVHVQTVAVMREIGWRVVPEK